MRHTRSFPSRDYAQGFAEGIEYVNDSALTSVSVTESADSDDWIVTFDDAEGFCADCGHAADAHDRRGEDGECFDCNDSAQLGLYAPCAVVTQAEQEASHAGL